MGITGLLYAGNSIGESMFIGAFSGILLSFVLYVLPAIWRAIKKTSEPSIKIRSHEKSVRNSPTGENANKDTSNSVTADISQALGISTTERLDLETSQRAGASHADGNYESLLEELKEKCHPKQFMEPYDHEKVKVANELYSRILAASDDNKDMANKILIIGVGSAGVNAVDKMNVPNSKKLFIDTDYNALREVKSEDDKIGIACKARSECPSLYCHCFDDPDFCESVASDYEDEIRESIKKAFEEV